MAALLIPRAALVPASHLEAAVFSIPPGDVAALIDAIDTANANGEADTIKLAGSSYNLTEGNHDSHGPNGLPSIESNITFNGKSANRTVITGTSFRILYVASQGRLELNNITIAGGSLHGDGLNGAGIFNDGGTVTIKDSVIRNNYTHGAGGGLFIAGGTVTVIRSTVSQNSSCGPIEGPGGGIYNDGGTVTVTDSTVSENCAGGASGDGGGLYNASGTVTITNSTISNNNAYSGDGLSGGGGLFNYGSMTITNSTISGNMTHSFGDRGNISGGGGIQTFGPLTVRHSTVVDNVASDDYDGKTVAGGIFAPRGSVALIHTIVAGNRADDRTLHDCDGEMVSQGYNLVGDGTGCPSNGLDDQTVKPADVFTTVLGPLQANAGPTRTHALRPGSPAIDRGRKAPCLVKTDQRGIPRPQGEACDIGAVEFTGMPSYVYQAEDAEVRGGSRVESNHTGFNGTGFVNFSSNGGLVEWTGVDGGSGGRVLIALRYALGSNAARTARLIVNGKKKSITFEPTDDWSQWRYRYTEVNLEAGGNNIIAIHSVGDDSGNLDELVLGMQAEDMNTGGGSQVESNHTGFRGTGFVNFSRTKGFVVWSDVDGRNGGTAQLTFRYALDAPNPRTVELIVNDLVQSLTFEPTGSWTSWSTLKISEPLKPGTNNTIRLQTTGGDAGNLDQLFVTN